MHMPVAVNYHFSQLLSANAKEAFGWCTDFSPNDHQLMGRENAARKISPVSECTIIITDVFQTPAGKIEKQKLVQLYPDNLTWTSTHLTGPNKRSQFLYIITPEGKVASKLDFYANHMETDGKADSKLLAEKLCKEDAAVWALLAKALALEPRK
jgi:hypothetical protein